MKKHTYFLFLGLLSIRAFSQDLTNIKDNKPFAVSGSVDVRAIGYTASGIDPRRSPLSWMISGNPVFSFYGFTLPLSFTFTEQERSFGQPFNQFGLSPTWKWITLHGGYRNVSFSPYTLAGHTLLGGGFELKPKNFRVGFMTGRLNRATTIDTTTGMVNPYRFSRYGSAFKLGYGNSKGHFDLSFLQARDSPKGYKGNIDSTMSAMAANTALGADFRLTFPGNFVVFGDAGLSIYTHDVESTMEIETDSTQSALEKLLKFTRVNATSEYYLAYSGGIGYNSGMFGIQLEYKHVDPNFRSMGAFFFQNDLQNITLSPRLSLLKGNLMFSGSIGMQQDNRKKLKMATTKRMIGMANLMWNMNEKFGVDANYSNFTTNSEPTVALVENRYLLAQTNNSLSVTPRLLLAGPTQTQVFLLSFNANTMRDLSGDTLSNSDITSTIAFLNYNLMLNKLGLTIMAGLNYTLNQMDIGNSSNQGLTLGASKSLLNNKLMISSNNSYVLTDMAGGKGNILNIGGNISYRPVKGHRLNLRVQSLNNQRDRENAESLKYSELTGEIGYTYNF